MGLNLTRQIIRAHRLRPVRGGPEDTAGDWALRVDHVVVDQPAAAWVAAGLEGLGVSGIRAELALAGVDRGGVRAGWESSGRSRALSERLRRWGVHVLRPGRGRSERAHRERFSAPGKLVLSVGRRAPSCGAWGMLGLTSGALEAAAVLAGGALHVSRPRLMGVRLRGGLASWVSGQDLALRILRGLPRQSAQSAIVEILGGGVETLSMADRMAVATVVASLEVLAVVIPSDEITRGFLKAQGREADWKSMASEPDAGFDETYEIDLDAIEPMITAADDLLAARPVRQAKGMAVGRVLIGASAGVADLARVAEALRGGRVREGTELLIAPGSRQVFETAAATGVLNRLIEAGGRVLDGGAGAETGPAHGPAGAGLSFGVRFDDACGPAWYVASPESCGAAARAGQVVDPRELDVEYRRHLDPGAFVVDDAWLLRPLPSGGEARPGASAIRPCRRLEGSLRGAVLLKLGDRVGTDQILPWGARMEPLVDDWEKLSQHAFAPIDPRFAERARRLGGGFVMAGREFGSGERRELAATAAMSLGVRAILARSFDRRFHGQLVHAGVMPLRLQPDGDDDAIASGDELEVPGLPDALEPGKPLVVRNLTRGTQHTLSHALDAHDVALLRAGGILSFVLAESSLAAERPA